MSPARFDPVALRAARLRKGLTQAAVARAVGLSSDAQVWRWEHGQDEPAPRALPALAKVLGVSALDLFERDDGPTDLRVLRKASGLTLTEMARQSGITYTRYRGIELGRLTPQADEVERLASQLGVDDAWRAIDGDTAVTRPRQ